MKTRFELEEENAARCDARCFFFEHQYLFDRYTSVYDHDLDFDICCCNPYSNHGNCSAAEIFRQTIIELVEQQCQKR